VIDRLLQPKLVDIGSVLDGLSDCQVDDVLLVAIYDLADVVGEG
jgi:hypothetical protein